MESSNDHIKYAGDNDVIQQDEVTGEWLNRAGKPVFDKEKQNYVNRNSYGETLAVWSGTTKAPYQTLMGFIFPDGSTFYFGTGYTPGNSFRSYRIVMDVIHLLPSWRGTVFTSGRKMYFIMSHH